jgi:hypothetical protein
MWHNGEGSLKDYLDVDGKIVLKWLIKEMCTRKDWNYVAHNSDRWADSCETTDYALGLHKLWERLNLENSFASWSLEGNFGV